MVAANRISQFVIVVLLLGATSHAEALSKDPVQADSVTAARTLAQQYKELGDQHVSQDRLAAAAGAYARALSLARDPFSLDERVRMAIYLSWDNRLDTAIDELHRVLEQNPQHTAARIHLARVYSWSGALAEAIAEADEVLRMVPGNPETLLIKADALEWRGYFREAIPIYQEILDHEDRFDARLGLSYALLSAGNRAAAAQNARHLATTNSREEKQFTKLMDEIASDSRPKLDLRYNQYGDSDHNQNDRYSLMYGFGLGNQGFSLNVKRTDTRSETGRNRADAASFNIASNVAEGLRVGASVGMSRLGDAVSENFNTGQLRADVVVSNATIIASAGTDMLADTSELISNHIRATSYVANVSKPWTGRLSTSAAYAYKTFSDGNRAHDTQITPQYTVHFAPRLAIGYRFRYLDFRTQTGSGFFDPDRYSSHRLFSSVSWENRKLSTYIDVFGGKQHFTRYGSPSNDWIVGGSGSIGFKPVQPLLIEINGEGGNFSAGSVTGFKYFIVGTRVSYRF